MRSPFRSCVALVAAAVCVTASLHAEPKGRVQLSVREAAQSRRCPDDVATADSTWAGVKAVSESLDPAQPADSMAPISLSSGPRGAVHVQWTRASGGSRLTRLSASGVDGGALLTHGGTASRGGATLRAACGEYVPTLANENSFAVPGAGRNAPQIQVKSPLGYSDYGRGSEQAVVVQVARNRAILVGKAGPWDASNGAFREPQPFAAVLQPQAYGGGWTVSYNAPPLNDDPEFWKGRFLPAPSSNFTVSAASSRPSGGLLVGGSYSTGVLGANVYLYALDAEYRLEHHAVFSYGLLPRVASVAQDGDGQVIVCGTYVALPVSTRAYVAKFDASLGAPVVTTFAFGDASTVGGCALTGTGELVMSGSYSGSYARRVSRGRDLFMASISINDPGAAVTVARFSSYGTTEDESDISPPLVEGRNAFVAGVTAGEWGDATGSSSAKIFVAKVDTATLALL